LLLLEEGAGKGVLKVLFLVANRFRSPKSPLKRGTLTPLGKRVRGD